MSSTEFEPGSHEWLQHDGGIEAYGLKHEIGVEKLATDDGVFIHVDGARAQVAAAYDIPTSSILDSAKQVPIKEIETAERSAERGKPKVRHAKLEDIDELTDLDLLLFEKAYGEDLPSRDEIKNMLTRRFLNNPNGMFVATVDGKVEGFVSAFPTDVPFEEFKSWEHSTANGTLDGKVKPSGKYVYVTNMTIKHEAVVQGAEEMLIAQLFANAIQEGSRYGYFVSRMPHFKRWTEANQLNLDNLQELDVIAKEYSEKRDEDGKRIDPQLKMYEGFGFKLVRVVANAFDDDASLNFGVVCKVAVPPANKHLKNIKPVRWAMANALRMVARYPNLLKKVL